MVRLPGFILPVETIHRASHPRQQLPIKRNLNGKYPLRPHGGLGVDTYFFSRNASKVTYVEQNETYCEAARANFLALGATNIEVCHADATVMASRSLPDTYYIDPARRTSDNKRVFALTDYAPNVLEIKETLLRKVNA